MAKIDHKKKSVWGRERKGSGKPSFYKAEDFLMHEQPNKTPVVLRPELRYRTDSRLSQETMLDAKRKA